MPLLVSPIDGSPMKQINRYGIELDVCPTTGGIWLDRGELEKLMALIKDETSGFGEDSRRENSPREDTRRDDSRRYDRDDDDDDRYRGSHGGAKRKSRLSDLFDF